MATVHVHPTKQYRMDIFERNGEFVRSAVADNVHVVIDKAKLLENIGYRIRIVSFETERAMAFQDESEERLQNQKVKLSLSDLNEVCYQCIEGRLDLNLETEASPSWARLRQR